MCEISVYWKKMISGLTHKEVEERRRILEKIHELRRTNEMYYAISIILEEIILLHMKIDRLWKEINDVKETISEKMEEKNESND